MMPNQAIQFTTNSEFDTTLVIKKKAITFKELWDNYPNNPTEHIDPKTGKDVFGDHCAINISDSLHKSGVLLKAFQGTRCWHCTTPKSNGKNIHAIRAQELADYLNKTPFAGCPVADILSAQEFEKKVQGKTGIIFFKDYWQRNGQTGRTGDHIDLWNKNKLANNGLVATWLRTTFSEFSESYLNMSDLKKSKSVSFWQIM